MWGFRLFRHNICTVSLVLPFLPAVALAQAGRGQIMSYAVVALQEHAATVADAFCRRSEPAPSRKGQQNVRNSQRCVRTEHPRPKTCPERRRRIGTFYRPRDHEASPFFKIVRDRFDEFERVYPERYQERYGYWRPVIRSSIDKFMKCGDLKEGFARVRCPVSNLTITRKTPIFSHEVGKSTDGGSGKTGKNKSVCKENIFIHQPAPEKSNFLSVHRNWNPFLARSSPLNTHAWANPRAPMVKRGVTASGNASQSWTTESRSTI
jgi:hypothetical protein